jgi:hypothetical protein
MILIPNFFPCSDFETAMSSMWPARAHEWILCQFSKMEIQFRFDEEGTNCYNPICVVFNNDGEI